MKVKNKLLKFKSVKTRHYTKAELKIIKDMTLNDQEVATRLDRTKQAIYCKRWTMRLYGPKKRTPKLTSEFLTKLDQTISEKVAKDTVSNSVERIVLGNVTIDLVSKTLTVHF